MNDLTSQVRFRAEMPAFALVMASIVALTFAWCSQSNAQQYGQDGTMSIRVVIDGAVLTATLDDSGAARDFVSLLPLELTLNDYASTEKVSDLPRRLSTEGAPRSYKPSAGDITYYAPWGNLAIFYRSFSESAGLVRLGAFNGNINALRRDQPFKARFELAD